ncbi:hypothetical protein HPB50_024443 [Hyalomma asiaticum]|uniref:Uncharacterized protein n=1 Tax=Hyalomma asiaticum TaxID=266040 RepID=A0ACB7SPR9_HYAAI|nr:hypothetical protein HPB50_024443 [Hyalomma asiaticum]
MGPDIYPNYSCAACGEPATLCHVLWECGSLGPKFTKEEWDVLLRSPVFEDQILAVQPARDRACRPVGPLLGLAGFVSSTFFSKECAQNGEGKFALLVVFYASDR